MEKSWPMPSLFACRFLQRNINYLFFCACNNRDVYYVFGKCWTICSSESEDISLLNSPRIHEFNLVKLGISGGWSNLKVIKAIKKQMLPWLLVSQGWPPTEIWGRSADPHVQTFLDFAWFSQSVTLNYDLVCHFKKLFERVLKFHTSFKWFTACSPKLAPGLSIFYQLPNVVFQLYVPLLWLPYL